MRWRPQVILTTHIITYTPGRLQVATWDACFGLHRESTRALDICTLRALNMTNKGFFAVLAAATMLLVVFAQPAAARGAYVLSEKNFDEEVLQSDDLWIVEFYAPWCGHCKHLAPIYDAAADKVKAKGLMKMGKIDATVETALAKRYGVKGYPTLKYLRDGELHKYIGERTVDGFVEFAERMNGDSITELKTKYELSKFKMKKEVTYMYGAGKDAKGFDKKATFQVYRDIAYRLQAEEYFSVVTTPEMQERAVGKLPFKPYIARLERGEESQLFEDEVTEDAVIQWIDETKFPTVIKLDARNFDKSAHAGKLLITLVLDPKQDNKQQLDELTQLARKSAKNPLEPAVQEKFLYGWIDGVEHKKFVKQYGITEKSLPSAIIFDAPKKMHFKNVDIKVKGALGHYLKAIALGEEDPTAEGYMAYYYTGQKLFNRSWPYSLIAVVVLVALVVMTCWTCCKALCDDDEEYDVYEEDTKKTQ